MEAPIKISRDCDSTLIPSGDKITLIEGTLVRITQALGGDYTLYVNGNLVKLSGKDGDAIGKEVVNQTEKNKINNGEYSEELVWEQLRTCFDPEIPVNIVDLGLILTTSEKSIEDTSLSSAILIFFPSELIDPLAFFPSLSLREKTSFDFIDTTLSLSILIVPAKSVFKLIVFESNPVTLPEIIDPSSTLIRSADEKETERIKIHK